MLYHFIHYCCCWMPIALILSPSLKLARKNKIIVFYLPLHTTHVCQPLDCGFFKPLKDYWRDECHKFYQKNPGLVISKYNFCGIFREAWLKAISPSNIIISGFKKAGVHPVNRNKVLLSSNNSANKQDNGDINTDDQSVIAVDRSVNTDDSSAVSPDASVGTSK